MKKLLALIIAMLITGCGGFDIHFGVNAINKVDDRKMLDPNVKSTAGRY